MCHIYHRNKIIFLSPSILKIIEGSLSDLIIRRTKLSRLFICYIFLPFITKLPLAYFAVVFLKIKTVFKGWVVTTYSKFSVKFNTFVNSSY